MNPECKNCVMHCHTIVMADVELNFPGLEITYDKSHFLLERN